MRKLIIISLLTILTSSSFAQLIPLQSQYMFNGIALNPAYTGSEDAMSIVGSLRAQWVGFPGAPRTEAITIHAPLKKMKSSIGLQVYGDQIGIDRNTGVFGSYAYRLKLNQGSLNFGVSGGLNFVRSKYSELDVNQTQDILLINDSPLGLLPDVSFGVHYNTDNFFVSASLPQFLSHNFDGTKFKIRNEIDNYSYMLGGGYLLKLKNGITFKPSILAKMRLKTKPQFDFNLMTSFNETFDFGLSYRTQEAIIGLVQFNINQQFSIMYSGGAPLSPILKYTFGSHELSLKYTFKYKTQITSPRFLGW